jgi:hypothetical protein
LRCASEAECQEPESLHPSLRWSGVDRHKRRAHENREGPWLQDLGDRQYLRPVVWGNVICADVSEFMNWNVSKIDEARQKGAEKRE